MIIFDEAQMIPPEHLKPCLAVIEELAAQYGSSVVLCTATQPTFQNFSREIGSRLSFVHVWKSNFAFSRGRDLKISER